MYLFREVMDKEIVDVKGFKAGKVDDLLLELQEEGRPVVRAILTQQGALTSLMGGLFVRIAQWFRNLLLGPGPEVDPITIGWEHVTHIDVVVHMDLDRWSADLMTSEQLIWERWIKRLPFAER